VSRNVSQEQAAESQFPPNQTYSKLHSILFSTNPGPKNHTQIKQQILLAQILS